MLFLFLMTFLVHSFVFLELLSVNLVIWIYRLQTVFFSGAFSSETASVSSILLPLSGGEIYIYTHTHTHTHTHTCKCIPIFYIFYSHYFELFSYSEFWVHSRHLLKRICVVATTAIFPSSNSCRMLTIFQNQ